MDTSDHVDQGETLQTVSRLWVYQKHSIKTINLTLLYFSDIQLVPAHNGKIPLPDGHPALLQTWLPPPTAPSESNGAGHGAQSSAHSHGSS